MSTSPYHEAGGIVNELLSSKSGGGRGLKSIIFSKNKSKDGPNKAAYATVCKTMQHIPIINAVLNENDGKLRKVIGLDSVHNKGLMYVMLYELLFSKYKSIRGGGKLKRMIIKYEQDLRKGICSHVSKGGGLGEATAKFPRYVRVNVMQTSFHEMVDMLKREGFSDDTSPETNMDKQNQLRHTVFADSHVPDLLVLHPSASSFLHQEHEAVKSGKLVLQDKSSCFSALVLARGNNNAPMNCDFIDACAAPGNKTTHLAALVSEFYKDVPQTKKSKRKGSKAASPKSTIFAFERSSSRFKVLQSRINTLVPPSEKVLVEPLLGDFLKSDPTSPQFANVRCILLDPSCSGSGIVNSPDRWLEDAGEDINDDATTDNKAKRIQSLANFQLVALKHAMSFPSVDRIAYSTCSVHDEENEVVVGKALSEINASIQGSGEKEWQLVSPECLRHWPRRGKAGGIGGLSADQAKCLIRCDGLDGDETNGFFVSYFERKKQQLNETGQMNAANITDNHVALDIPFYKGQFSTIQNEKKESKTNHNEQIQHSLKEKQQKDRSGNEKSKEKVMAKKKAKKLAWKQKQALQKLQRLKKKEKGSSTDYAKE